MRRSFNPSIFRVSLVVVAVVLLAAACGGNDNAPTAPFTPSTREPPIATVAPATPGAPTTKPPPATLLGPTTAPPPTMTISPQPGPTSPTTTTSTVVPRPGGTTTTSSSGPYPVVIVSYGDYCLGSEGLTISTTGIRDSNGVGHAYSVTLKGTDGKTYNGVKKLDTADGKLGNIQNSWSWSCKDSAGNWIPIGDYTVKVTDTVTNQSATDSVYLRPPVTG